MEAQQDMSSISALVFFFFFEPAGVREVSVEAQVSVERDWQPRPRGAVACKQHIKARFFYWLGPDSRTLSPLPVAPSAALSLLLIEPRWANNTQPRASLASHFYGLIVIVKPSLPPIRSRDHPSCFRISPSAASPSSRMWS